MFVNKRTHSQTGKEQVMENDTPEVVSQETGAGLDSALDKAFDSSQTEESNEESVVEISAPESKEKPQVEQKEDIEEDVFTHYRPDEIPDELKPLYKSMQRDYTSKRQADSQKVKELESKLSEVEQTREQMQTINGLIAKAKAGDEMAFRQLMELQTERPETEEDRVRRIIKEERESGFYEQAKRDYSTLDDRVDENSPSYDPRLDKWLKANLADSLDTYYENEGTNVGFDYKAEASRLTKEWDEYISSLNKAYVKRQSEIVKKKSDELSKGTPHTSSAEARPNKKMGLDDALEAAASTLQF